MKWLLVRLIRKCILPRSTVKRTNVSVEALAVLRGVFLKVNSALAKKNIRFMKNMKVRTCMAEKKGFQYRFWNIDSVSEGENPQAVLSYHSEHLEEGYPGNLKVQVTYQLTEDNQVKITYRAETDRDTIVNLTNHAYFNLNGSGSVSDHFMQVNASKILELDERNLPTGNLTKLKNHPKDHRESKLLGNRELDDVYVLDTMENETQVQLFSPLSGIKLKLKSNQPVVVIYSPESLPDKWQYLAQIDEKFPAVALEAQNYPDAPNFRNFPSSLLKKGEVYENEIVYSFSVK